MIDFSTTFKGKKVLITGGLGFIGSNLAHRLLDLDAEILLLDALIPGQGGNLFNVSDIKDRVRVNISNVCDLNSLSHLVSGQDYIFDLAGSANHQDSIGDPFADLEINCRSHLTLLEACRRVNPDARIVFTSNRNQYGRLTQTPVNEQHPRLPVEPNGIHNITAEYYYLLYNYIHGLRTTSLRLTNTYGPRHLMQHHKQGVASWFIRLVSDNREVYIFGDGKQIRDLNYVDDVLDAMLLTAATEDTVGEVYNLGGSPICLADLVRKLIEMTGTGGYKLVPYPDQLKITEIGNYVADYSKIKNQLGWEPKISLHDGLRRTIAFYERYKQHYW